MSENAYKAISISLSIVAIVWFINGVYLSVLSHYSILAFWLVDLVQWVVLPLTIIFFLSNGHQVYPRHYGLPISQITISSLFLGLIVALTLYPSFFLVRNYAWVLLGGKEGFFTFANVYPEGVLGTVVWLYSALSAGLVESLFFIGLPWLIWSNCLKNSAFPFVIVSSLVFAAVHWEQGMHTVIGAFTFEVVACAWFFRLKSLWPIVFGHMVIDLVAYA